MDISRTWTIQVVNIGEHRYVVNIGKVNMILNFHAQKKREHECIWIPMAYGSALPFTTGFHWHGPSLTSTLGPDSFTLDPLAGRSRFKSLSESSPMSAPRFGPGTHPQRSLQPKRFRIGQQKTPGQWDRWRSDASTEDVFDVFFFSLAMSSRFITFSMPWTHLVVTMAPSTHRSGPCAFGKLRLEVSAKCAMTWRPWAPWGCKLLNATWKRSRWKKETHGVSNNCFFFCKPMLEIYGNLMNMVNSARKRTRRNWEMWKWMQNHNLRSFSTLQHTQNMSPPLLLY